MSPNPSSSLLRSLLLSGGNSTLRVLNLALAVLGVPAGDLTREGLEMHQNWALEFLGRAELHDFGWVDEVAHQLLSD